MIGNLSRCPLCKGGPIAHQMQDFQVVSQCLECGWYLTVNGITGERIQGQTTVGTMWDHDSVAEEVAFTGEQAKIVLNKEGEKADPDKKKYRIKKAKELGEKPADLLRKEYLRR